MSISLRQRSLSDGALPRGVIVAIAAGVVVSVGLGVPIGAAVSTKTALIPLAAFAALLLAGLALTRFVWFVLAILVARSSLDLFRAGSVTTGQATGGTGQSGGRMFNPSTIVAILFLLAAILWLLAQRRRYDLSGSVFRMALLTLLATMFLSIVGAHNKASVLVELMRDTAAVVMFVVVELLARDLKRLRYVIAAVLSSVIVPVGLVGLTLASGHLRTAQKGGLSRITGSFNQPNLFGRYLMMMVIMAVAIYPSLSPRFRRIVGAMIAACGLCILFTYTRTALVGTVLGLTVVGFASGRKRVVFALFAVCFVLLAMIPSVGGRFTELFGGGSSNTTTGSNSLEWRLSYWPQVLPAVKDSPLTGIGIGQSDATTQQQALVHNDYLRAFVELGIVGLLAYVGVLASLIMLGWHARNAAPPGFERGVAIGLLGCAVAYAAVSAVANVYSNVVTLWYLYSFAGCGAAIIWRSQMLAPEPIGVAA